MHSRIHKLRAAALKSRMHILAIKTCMARGRLLPGCKAAPVCIPYAWVTDPPTLSTAGPAHICLWL